MAFVTAFLARAARRNAGRARIVKARTSFESLGDYLQAIRQAWIEAQEMRRLMTRKYPFMDI